MKARPVQPQGLLQIPRVWGLFMVAHKAVVWSSSSGIGQRAQSSAGCLWAVAEMGVITGPDIAHVVWVEEKSPSEAPHMESVKFRV